MQLNFDEENDYSIYKNYKYFELKYFCYLYMYKFIFENGQLGKVYIDFVNIIDFNEKVFLDEVWVMCEKDINVGGNLEILEGVFYEIFYRVGYVKYVKVSRVWFFVFCIC